jgi:hypothetical protein
MLHNIEQGRGILLEKSNFALFSGIIVDEEPSTFQEAWNHEDPKARGKLQNAIKRSFVIWINNKFGRSLRKRIFQRIEEPSNGNRFSKQSEMEFLEQEW